jgi:hypothetical protein
MSTAFFRYLGWLCRAPRPVWQSGIVAGLTLLMVFAWSVAASGQHTKVHQFHRADLPPGVVGRGQLIRETIPPYHHQPVEIQLPKGAEVSLANGGMFEPPEAAPLKVGMMIGQVYRLRITNIPFSPGQEVYPTVEVINRLCPPPGREWRYPIPIQITREELLMAVQGQYIVRVVYLEDPKAALPQREDPQQQRYFDVGPAEDPLQTADQLGRPMAIIRLGSRTPDVDPNTGIFTFNSPPWTRAPIIEEPATLPSGVGEGLDAEAAAYQKPLEPPIDSK